MAQSKSPLGRLRERIGYTQKQAATARILPVRTIVNYEAGGGRFGVHLRHKIEYADWLIEQARMLGLPGIPDRAELLPDVYGEQIKNRGELTPTPSHG